MKKLLFIASFLTAGAVSAQSFEGVIEFRQQTSTDTINRVYYVKGDKVRIDEIGSMSKKVEGTFLVDLKAGKMVFLSHERKLWGEQPTSMPGEVKGTPTVTRTKETKTIQGYKCVKYVVKNKDDNTQIVYWIASGKFDFFGKMMKVLNRKEKVATYYGKLTGVDGMFPFLAVETGIDGKDERGRLEVTKVEKKVVDASMLEVPKGYNKLEK
jgi:hypothetical protein